MEESVFATPSLSFVHPGLSSTDQLIVPSTPTWAMKAKCTRCAFSPKKAMGKNPRYAGSISQWYDLEDVKSLHL